MHRCAWNPARRPRKARRAPLSRTILVSLAFLGLLLQPGCLFRKHKAPAAPPTLPPPVRLVLLPMNIPDDKAELQWASMGTTVMMAESALAAPDLELVPLHESIPAVLQSLGNSRHITDEIAEFTAARLSARWAAEGEIMLAKDSITLRVDFMPSKPSLVPFRYEKACPVDAMDIRVQEACSQFLEYLIVRPMAQQKPKPLDLKKVKEIAQALDVEYGWSATAKPGQAGDLVEELARTNRNLAKLLFSATLYPTLAK